MLNDILFSLTAYPEYENPLWRNCGEFDTRSGLEPKLILSGPETDNDSLTCVFEARLWCWIYFLVQGKVPQGCSVVQLCLMIRI